MTVSDPLDRQEKSFKSAGVIARSGPQCRPYIPEIERGNSAASVHSCPGIGRPPQSVFLKPVRITGAEVKADAEVESL